jgi:uracil-DNA glycosylase
MTSYWKEIQESIWNCSLCGSNPRVQFNVREQTQRPKVPVKLLIVSIAPSFVDSPTKMKAETVLTEDANNLRNVIEECLGIHWDNLLKRNVAVLHAVKCAIVPQNGYESPPRGVIDTCSSRHFARELRLLQPAVVVTLGRIALRAVLNIPNIRAPKEFRTAMPLRGDFAVSLDDFKFSLFVSRFIRIDSRAQAQNDLRRAADAAGVLSMAAENACQRGMLI